MESIQTWRDSISWFVAAISVVVSYELRNSGFVSIPPTGFQLLDKTIPAIAATAVLLLSLTIAKKLSTWAISKSSVREYILGENYVEGFWHLRTDPHSEDATSEQSPISPDGVLWLRYEPSWGQYSVTTTRLDENGRAYQVPSKIVNLRKEGQLLLYVNYFVLSHTGDHSTEGVAKGNFVKKGDFSKTKDRLDAFSFTEGQNTRHQWAEKIESKDIANCKKESPGENDNWMETYLRNITR